MREAHDMASLVASLRHSGRC